MARLGRLLPKTGGRPHALHGPIRPPLRFREREENTGRRRLTHYPIAPGVASQRRGLHTPGREGDGLFPEDAGLSSGFLMVEDRESPLSGYTRPDRVRPGLHDYGLGKHPQGSSVSEFRF